LKKASLLVLTVLALTVFVAIPPARCGDGKVERWVLLVGTTPEVIGESGSHQTLRDTYYFYHLLVYDIGISADHVMYLYVWKVPPPILQDYDAIDDVANISSVGYYITQWLKPNADEDDIVLIYIVSHGRGAFEDGTWADKPARIDGSAGDLKDEGDEHYNTVISDTWFGVDEGLWFYNDEAIYWDDDFRQDLDELPSCTQIIILESCFGGGFIDDLSASNRVIVTAADETYFAVGDADGDGFSEFSEVFIDALHGYDTSWDEYDPANPIKHESSVNADFDENGRVSIQEAFDYALENDPYEYPWLDCDGDGLPTFINGCDELDSDQPPADVYIYERFTLTISYSSGGCVFPGPGTYRYKEGTVVWLMAWPFSGYYFVWWWVDGGIRYGEDWGIYNNLFLEMNSDHFVYACFAPGTGGGGGEACPTLFVWNGTAWIDYGVIDIHNPSGEDMVREVPVLTEDVGISNSKAMFRLREGWEGLNYSESVIDKVKLYAVDNYGNFHLCLLTRANHSSLGNVLSQLLKSDDIRVQTLLLETIDLTFKVPKDIHGFTFVIEGCNMLKM
jgi:hypothetical protein